MKYKYIELMKLTTIGRLSGNGGMTIDLKKHSVPRLPESREIVSNYLLSLLQHSEAWPRLRVYSAT